MLIMRRFQELKRSLFPSSFLLYAATTIITLSVAAPLFYILLVAGGAGPNIWELLKYRGISALFGNTIALAATSGIFATALGTLLAILVERTDLPAKRYWQIALVLPFVVPPYVRAITYLGLLPRGGVLHNAFGFFITPYGFWGSVFMLTLYSYVYSFLYVSAALGRVSRNLEESARIAGYGPWETIFKVTLRLVLPAIGAGWLFPALASVADYGVVALMRYDTLAIEIYNQITSRFNRELAAVISLIPIVLALLFMAVEVRLRGKGRFSPSQGWQPPKPISLGRARIAAVGFVALVVAFALLIPLLFLLVWSFQGFFDESLLTRWRLGGNPWAATLRTALIAAGVATVAVIFSLPLAYLKARRQNKISGFLWQILHTGYALPGVVVALGLVFLNNRLTPFLYGTIFVLGGAYIISFLSQSSRAIEAGLTQVPVRLEEASRGLGQGSIATFLRVNVPLIFPSLLAGWALVFLNSVKELPATLILRPTGFETLSVRVWISAFEGVYLYAAFPALLMILVSVPPVWFLLRKRGYQLWVLSQQ